MSDVMLLGVLRMPMPESPDAMTLLQFVDRARQAADRIEADAALIERLRKDAERYRWLRDNKDSDWAICQWSDDDREGLGYYRDGRAAHVVDAAIDAAMSPHPAPVSAESPPVAL